MSEDASGCLFCGAALFLCCCLIGIGFACGRDYMRKEAVQHGHAEYSQQTGEWQWKSGE